MKTKSPANKSAPKARVMKCTTAEDRWGFLVLSHGQTDGFGGRRVRQPCLVRPCHSRKQAAQLARFANLTWEEKVAFICKAIFARYGGEKCVGQSLRNSAPIFAQEILRALGEQPGKAEGRE